MLSEVSGMPVYDSDTRAQEVINTHPQVRSELIELFGEEVFVNGIYNRPLVASKVFGDKELLMKLNAIVHPRVVEDYERWVKQQTGFYVILESALLFTSPLVGLYDLAVVVDAPEELRVERCMKRDGSTAEQVRARMARQMRSEHMIQMADRVVVNDEKTPLLPQLLKIDELMR